MPIVPLQLDQLLVDRAAAIGIAFQKAQRSDHATDPEHVLSMAINHGLEHLRQVWCPSLEDSPPPVEGRFSPASSEQSTQHRPQP